MQVAKKNNLNGNNTNPVLRFSGKRVLVTGHSGFKGPWLCECLLSAGAKVAGYSTGPISERNLYTDLDIASRIDIDIHADIRDGEKIKSAVVDFQPDFIFHMAAQSLVGEGYASPIETFETNCAGTVNLLEAVRHLNRRCVVVVVTTDKVYENREWNHAYRESDRLGGFDPYSASKACCEIMTSCYKRSFLDEPRLQGPIAVVTARAGNVIGGGDWTKNRIVPDCIDALHKGIPIPVRNKRATRPWQHVLEPLSGYMTLAATIEAILDDEHSADRFEEVTSAFNFGPELDSNQSVERLVERVLSIWPGTWIDKTDEAAVHEAGKLNLASDRAFHILGWRPRWRFSETVDRTVAWYSDYFSSTDRRDAARHCTQRDIDAYFE